MDKYDKIMAQMYIPLINDHGELVSDSACTNNPVAHYVKTLQKINMDLVNELIGMKKEIDSLQQVVAAVALAVAEKNATIPKTTEPAPSDPQIMEGLKKESSWYLDAAPVQNINTPENVIYHDVYMPRVSGDGPYDALTCEQKQQRNSDHLVLRGVAIVVADTTNQTQLHEGLACIRKSLRKTCDFDIALKLLHSENPKSESEVSREMMGLFEAICNDTQRIGELTRNPAGFMARTCQTIILGENDKVQFKILAFPPGGKSFVTEKHLGSPQDAKLTMVEFDRFDDPSLGDDAKPMQRKIETGSYFVITNALHGENLELYESKKHFAIQIFDAFEDDMVTLYGGDMWRHSLRFNFDGSLNKAMHTATIRPGERVDDMFIDEGFRVISSFGEMSAKHIPFELLKVHIACVRKALIKHFNVRDVNDTASLFIALKQIYPRTTCIEVMEYLLGVKKITGTANFNDRLEKTGSLDWLDRMIARMWMIADIHGENFMAWDKFNVDPLVDYCLDRPRQAYRASAGVLCKPGVAMIEFDKPRFRWTKRDDGTYAGYFDIRTGAVMKNPSHRRLLPDALLNEYLSGEDTTFANMSTDISTRLRSIICRMVPRGSVCGSIHDITGKVNIATKLKYSSVQKFNDFELAVPSSSFYNVALHLDTLNSEMTTWDSRFRGSEARVCNTVVLQGHQRMWNDATNSFTKIVIACDAFGDKVDTGCMKKRCVV